MDEPDRGPHARRWGCASWIAGAIVVAALVMMVLLWVIAHQVQVP